MMILPGFSRSGEKAREQKTVMEIVSAAARLKHQTISFMEPGEISIDENDLVFYLGHREILRMDVPDQTTVIGPVYFNRYGITTGGEIILNMKRRYRIVIQEMNGIIRVE